MLTLPVRRIVLSPRVEADRYVTHPTFASHHEDVLDWIQGSTCGAGPTMLLSSWPGWRYIAKADAWLGAADVSGKNVAKGPEAQLTSSPRTTLSCDFLEPDPNDPPGGRTPKFECDFDVNGKRKTYKVKYDPASVTIDGKPGTRNLEVSSFINHMDNKAEQQRLVCRSKENIVAGRCENPVLMIQDAGSSFGLGWAPLQGAFRLNKIDLQKWVNLSVWADLGKCIVKINGAPNASLRVSQPVSEEARAWVASLGGPTVGEWVAGFKEKARRDIIEARCGM